MNPALRTARHNLRRTRNLVAGLLIGAGAATPVFAANAFADELADVVGANAIASDQWTMLLLAVSVVLLGVGLLLKLRQKQHAAQPPIPPAAEQYRYTLEQDRPQTYH